MSIKKGVEERITEIVLKHDPCYEVLFNVNGKTIKIKTRKDSVPLNKELENDENFVSIRAALNYNYQWMIFKED